MRPTTKQYKIDLDGLYPRRPPYPFDPISDWEKIKRIQVWIRFFLSPQKEINKNSHSYGLKHICEKGMKDIWDPKWGSNIDTYVSNGEFIYAMKEEGYEIVASSPDSLNAYFNTNTSFLKDVQTIQIEIDKTPYFLGILQGLYTRRKTNTTHIIILKEGVVVIHKKRSPNTIKCKYILLAPTYNNYLNDMDKIRAEIIQGYKRIFGPNGFNHKGRKRDEYQAKFQPRFIVLKEIDRINVDIDIRKGPTLAFEIMEVFPENTDKAQALIQMQSKYLVESEINGKLEKRLYWEEKIEKYEFYCQFELYSLIKYGKKQRKWIKRYYLSKKRNGNLYVQSVGDSVFSVYEYETVLNAVNETRDGDKTKSFPQAGQKINYITGEYLK
jgi:hypothetical protein